MSHLDARAPFGLFERKVVTGLKPAMDIAITVTAAPASEVLLLDAAAALQREFGGALEFRWLAPGEAMDLILAEEKAPSGKWSRRQLGTSPSIGACSRRKAAGNACSSPIWIPPLSARKASTRWRS
ncbi:MAG: hypothetical protein ACLPWS_06345 [Rhodomicrobium sp.]